MTVSDLSAKSHAATEMVSTMCRAIDTRDAELFGSFFTDDAYMRFGNADAVRGRTEITSAVASTLPMLLPLRHHIDDITQAANRLYCTFTIGATAADGTELALPCVTVIETGDGEDAGRVVDYRVHMDIAPAFAGPPAPTEGDPNASASLLSDEEIIALQKKTVSHHVDAENRHAMTEVYETFVDGAAAFYDVVPIATRHPGRAGVEQFYEYMFAAFDFAIEVTQESHSRGVSAIEVTISGVHQAEFMGIPATGRQVEFEAAAFFLFDQTEPDKLICERVYFDVENILSQMRGEPVGLIGLRAEASLV